MPTVKAVLFDYGHTLVNMLEWDEYLTHLERRLEPIVAGRLPDDPAAREAAIKSAIRRVATNYDNSYINGDIEEQVLRYLYQEAFAHHGVQLDAADLDAVIDEDHAISAETFTIGDGVAGMLEELKRRGLKLGIVSNNIYAVEKAQAIWPLLRETDAHFSSIVFSSDVGVRKPHPAIYQAALQAIAIDPAELAFVGDRVREDLRGPKSQGIGRAFLTQEYRAEQDTDGEADGVLQRLPELLDHLS